MKKQCKFATLDGNIASLNTPKTFNDLCWFYTKKCDHSPSNSHCCWNESSLYSLLQQKLETRDLHNPGRLYFSSS